MKKTFFLLFLSAFLTCPAFAQEETLVGDQGIVHGGFGGPVIKFTQVNGEFGVLVGGRGGWIINHTFVIGGGGYGLVNNVEAKDLIFSEKPFLNFGYGGLELEYIMRSDELMHFSVAALIGAGGVTYRDKLFNNSWNWNNSLYGNDSFFVLEPAANLELNITSFFRLNAGVSYRLVSGVDYETLKNSDLSGPAAFLTLKFGKF